MRDFDSLQSNIFESIAFTNTTCMQGCRVIRVVAVVQDICFKRQGFKGHMLTLSMYLFVME